MRSGVKKQDRSPVDHTVVYRHHRVFYASVLVILAIVGGLYLRLAWIRYDTLEASSALLSGRTISALLHPEHIQALLSDAVEFHQNAFLFAKQSLTRAVQANSNIAQMFLVGMRNGEPTLLTDSTPTDQSGSNPSPGALYLLEKAAVLTALQTGRQTINRDVRNLRGAWITTLTPVFSEQAETPIAVLGISYPMAQWYQSIFTRIIADILAVLSLWAVSLALLLISREHLRLKTRSLALARDEALYHGLFDQAPIGISICSDDKVTCAAGDGRYSVNPVFESILGRGRQELEMTSWREITHPDGLQKDDEERQRFLRRQTDRYSLERKMIRPDGTAVWVNMTIGRLYGTQDGDPLQLCILMDITQQKMAEQALHESERSKEVLLSHLPGLAYRCSYDREWTMAYVSQGCETLTGYPAEALLDNRDLSYNDLIAPEYRQPIWDELGKCVQEQRSFRFEYEILTKGGDRRWVLEMGQAIFRTDGSVEALEGIVIDISELKLREAQITYMNEHDFLTGLLNRGRLEHEKNDLDKPENYPLSIVVFDINGVRMVNDAFGYAEGDRLIVDVANLIQTHCLEKDILARTGGDEFTLLLPRTGEAEVAQRLKTLANSVDRYNQLNRSHPYEVSVTFGYSTKTDATLTLDQTIIQAEAHMNHRKLLNQKSSHNSMLASIMATLYARSQETEEHGKRLTLLTRRIGVEMHLDQKALDDLELLSMLHDIGKVGIDDRILNKPGKLNAEEWIQMKRHSEIGYRIALSTPEFGHIAQFILHHHERWDGLGYPSGLRGDSIPLPARILMLADAYDAMTEDRVYRHALPKEEALKEIERSAGKQFDPEIAALFVRLMRSSPAQE
ncbi:MAG: PAS domain S-box protein [Clostridiales bacterium]|nr:PAS domain S-box protein [Clostridiales bacterium]